MLEKEGEELSSYEELFREYSQLLYIISHDFKAPLRTIRSFTELLNKELNGQLTPKSKEYLQFIFNGAKQLDSYLDTILEYSRLIRRGIQREKVPFKEVWNDVMQLLDSSITSAEAQITCDSTESIFADRKRITDVLYHLVRNCIMFRKIGEPLHIEIRCSEEGIFDVISVSDNARGIPAEFVPRLFGMFEIFHTHDSHKGFGMGLAFCKRVMEMHQGKLSWSPNGPSGSVFTLKFPKFGEEAPLDKGL